MRFSRDDIISDGRKLGINKGDFLFITADLLSVRYFNKDVITTENDWFCILHELVGPDGDFIVAAYTNSFLRFKIDKNIVYTKNSISTSGSLSNILIKNKFCYRSSHPTNSYVGFGERAKAILSKHNHNSSSYSIIDDILIHKPKNLLLGTVDNKNAPMSFHQVLHNIGYNYKNPFCSLGQSYYYDQFDNLCLFTRKDVGGCSSGSFKLLPSLINLSKSRVGHVGAAKCLLLDGIQANEKIKNLILSDINYAKCLDKSCISCHGRLNNPFFFIPYLLSVKKIYKKLFQ